jgi:intracellular septation protein
VTVAGKRRELSTGARLAVDFGPLLTFFLANGYAPVADGERIFVATGVFMAAMAVAMVYSKLRVGTISQMLWFNGAVVAVLGGLTLLLHDELFIKIKPTILYTLYAGLLFYALLSGKPLLKRVLADAYPPMADAGWGLLTRNWAWFFVAMALVNEAVWRTYSTDQWVSFKTWIVFPVTLVFAFAQAPILMRHGVKPEDVPVPPQG